MSYSLFFGRGSAGNVRGKQVAELLEGKQNPTEGYENDTCIYVKVIPPENHPKHAYLDVDDSTRALEFLRHHPQIGVIATCNLQKEYLTQELKRGDIVCIPHIHPNYENWRRPDREVKTVGIIGSRTSFVYSIPKMKKKLKGIGLDLLYEVDYWKTYGDELGMTEDQRRLKVVDFYKQIDIQIAWSKGAFTMNVEQMKNPNKLINAASFGIPTVASPNLHFMWDWKGYFMDAYSIEELVLGVEYLKDNHGIYQKTADRVFDYAKQYHRDEIKKLYLNL
jgi:hypothetical protein